jgi:hypothetical protein
MSEKLSEIFLNPAVKELGSIFRNAIRPPNDTWASDFASLVELEYVETPEQFKEIIWKFLRRYEVIARKHGLRRLSENSLDEIIKLVDKYGVKQVRAALIAHALVKSSEEGEKNARK